VIGWEHSFTHQIRDFLAAIESGTEPTPSFEEGLQVQRVLAAVEASAAKKGIIVALAATVKAENDHAHQRADLGTVDK
jgi:predicted dehydrogenase